MHDNPISSDSHDIDVHIPIHTHIHTRAHENYPQIRFAQISLNHSRHRESSLSCIIRFSATPPTEMGEITIPTSLCDRSLIIHPDFRYITGAICES